MAKYLKTLLQLILAPRFGWEDLDSEDLSPDRLFTRGFIPLTVLSGASVFMQMIYHPGLSPVRLLLRGVVEFGSFFLTYYIALLILTSVVPSLCFGTFDRNRLKLFVIESLGLMAILGILRNSLPSDYATVYFILIYISVIMWRAIDYLRILLRYEIKFTLMAIVSIIVPPLLIQLIFGAAGA